MTHQNLGGPQTKVHKQGPRSLTGSDCRILIFFFFYVRISHCSRGDLGTTLGVDLQTFLLLDSGKAYSSLASTRHRVGSTLGIQAQHMVLHVSLIITHVQDHSNANRVSLMRVSHLVEEEPFCPRKTRCEKVHNHQRGKGLDLPFTLSPTHDPGQAQGR